MNIWIACIIGAYFVGSIPFGVLIGKARGIDIRQHGSKNIGATNVGRTLGARIGFLCFFLDVLKGAIPIIVSGILTNVINHNASELTIAQMWLWLTIAAAAVLGHMFSIFLGFSGGKGVATSFGALLAMWPLLTIPALGALVVWYGTLRLSHYVSLASMLAGISLPIAYLLASIPRHSENVLQDLLHASPPLIVTALLAILVIVQHRANICRLMRGEEPKTTGHARRGGLTKG